MKIPRFDNLIPLQCPTCKGQLCTRNVAGFAKKVNCMFHQEHFSLAVTNGMDCMMSFKFENLFVYYKTNDTFYESFVYHLNNERKYLAMKDSIFSWDKMEKVCSELVESFLFL